MSTGRTLTMPPKKRPNPDRSRIEIRADPEWIEEVTKIAQNLGLGLSAFVRLAVNEKLRSLGIDVLNPKRKKE